MRNQQELQSPEFQDDMSDLVLLLKKEGIKYSMRRHMGAKPELLNILGYYPTGEWHIIVENLSIIRGMISFGQYELLEIDQYEDDPVRYSTAGEVLEEIKKRIKLRNKCQ